MKIIFYLLGEKGYQSLFNFLQHHESGSIKHVVAAQDVGVENDYFREIQKICNEYSIDFFPRIEAPSASNDIYSFVIGWRWLITNSDKLVVFHDSLLPKYRGFSPLVNMLINGENKIGVTALYAAEKYDCGNILWQNSINIFYPIKIQEAIRLISVLYTQAVVDIFEQLLTGNTILNRIQDEQEATYSLWRGEEDYLINWNLSSEKLQRFCDAVGSPFEGAMTYLNGEKIKVIEVKEYPDVVVEDREQNIGKIIFIDNNLPVIICGTGLLKIIKYEYFQDNNQVEKFKFRSRFTSMKNDSIQ